MLLIQDKVCFRVDLKSMWFSKSTVKWCTPIIWPMLFICDVILRKISFQECEYMLYNIYWLLSYYRILYNLLSNNFIDEHIKSRVRVAARQSKYALESSRENHASAWCSIYKCHLIEEKFSHRSTSQKSTHRSHRYFYM